MKRHNSTAMVRRDVTKDEKAFADGERFLAYRIVRETEKAIGLMQEDTTELLWLPKSQIDVVEMETGSAYVCIRPWLVEKKDFSKVSYINP